MDEKTEELRDIFLDVSDEATVTETQAETPGSLATDEEGVDEGIAAVVDRMRERFDFATDLDTDAYVHVVRGFYEGDDDEAIADAVDASADVVFRARMDLHLVRDADADAPFDLAVLRDDAGSDDGGEASDDALADELGVSPADLRRYRRVVAARHDARQVSQRFQSEFEDVLADAGLSTTMTESVRQDGLDEATEDIDSLDSDADVSF